MAHIYTKITLGFLVHTGHRLHQEHDQDGQKDEGGGEESGAQLQGRLQEDWKGDGVGQGNVTLYI